MASGFFCPSKLLDADDVVARAIINSSVDNRWIVTSFFSLPESIKDSLRSSGGVPPF